MSNSDQTQQSRPSEVRIRRAPKVATFLILGGGLGAVVTFIVTALFPVDPAVGFGALFGYFALYGVTAGVVLGGLVALILDRRSNKRATTVIAEVEVTDPAPLPETTDPDADAGPDPDLSR